MKKAYLFLISIVLTSGLCAQNSITFQVEELSRPDYHLKMLSHKETLERLILTHERVEFLQVKAEKAKPPYNILAHSPAPDSLVNFGLNSFFYGMYKSYAEHRPFVLSPDIIWLLICQGFSQHVNSNAEQARHFFVDFKEKKELVIGLPDATQDPNKAWESVFPQFTKLIGENLKEPDLVNILSADFSTTTATEKIATDITIMDAVKPYFEYSIYIVCGIPEITLKGTPEDWEKVLAKTKLLAKYDLEWWTSELEPILNEFIKASKGEIDTGFWMNMFKRHTPKKYAVTEEFNGWIVKFFPYSNAGIRFDLESITKLSGLNAEMVKVDLNIKSRTGDIIDTLELWAGFIGLEQNKSNFALTPQIGWLVRRKHKKEFSSYLKHNSNKWFRVTNVPTIYLPILLHGSSPDKKSERLEAVIVDFADTISLPDKITSINSTKRLYLNGGIDSTGIVKLRNRFPKIELIINDKRIAK